MNASRRVASTARLSCWHDEEWPHLPPHDQGRGALSNKFALRFILSASVARMGRTVQRLVLEKYGLQEYIVVGRLKAQAKAKQW